MTPEERAIGICESLRAHRDATGGCHNCALLAIEIQQAIEAEREEIAQKFEREGCNRKCGQIGRWPMLPENQTHWGNCSISYAEQIRARSSEPAKSGEKA